MRLYAAVLLGHCDCVLQSRGSTSYSAGGQGPPNITGLMSRPRDKPPPFPPPPAPPAQVATVSDATESIMPGGNGDDASGWNPFAAESMGELLLTLPVADAHTLSLVWPLPPLRQYYQYATDDYISHILGHEGPGSLTSQYVNCTCIFNCSVCLEKLTKCNWHTMVQVEEKGLDQRADVWDRS